MPRLMRANDTIRPDDDSRVTTRKRDMAAFDSLPAAIRAALNDHPLCMAAEDAVEAIREGYAIEDVLRGLKEAAA